jgi:hypothetical protein
LAPNRPFFEENMFTRISAVLVAVAIAVLAFGPAALAQPQLVKNYFSRCTGANCDNVLNVGGSLKYTGRGTVTQASSITTGVTVNATSGTITTVSQTVAAAAEATFTVTNSSVAATDTVAVAVKSANSGTGTFFAHVTAVGAGSFDVTLTNLHASAAGNSVIDINFVVLKSAT